MRCNNLRDLPSLLPQLAYLLVKRVSIDEYTRFRGTCSYKCANIYQTSFFNAIRSGRGYRNAKWTAVRRRDRKDKTSIDSSCESATKLRIFAVAVINFSISLVPLKVSERPPSTALNADKFANSQSPRDRKSESRTP